MVDVSLVVLPANDKVAQPDLHNWIPHMRPRTAHTGDLRELMQRYRALVEKAASMQSTPPKSLCGTLKVMQCFAFRGGGADDQHPQPNRPR